MTEQDKAAEQTWPERIYLVHSEDGYPVPIYKTETDEISWCENRNFDCDIEYVRADLTLSAPVTPAAEQQPCPDWESLAMALAAEEHDDIHQLIYEGGPIPEPWGEVWQKYEDDAKRMIAMVRKHAATPPAQDARISDLWEAIGYHSAQIAETENMAPGQKLLDAVKAVESALSHQDSGDAEDAARYRFVKTMTAEQLLFWRGGYGFADEAIDAARQVSNKEGA